MASRRDRGVSILRPWL